MTEMTEMEGGRTVRERYGSIAGEPVHCPAFCSVPSILLTHHRPRISSLKMEGLNGGVDPMGMLPGGVDRGLLQA